MNKTSMCKISFPLHPDPIMNEPGMCKSSIGYGSSLGVKFFVKKENCELTWKLKLKRGNVKLGIFRRPIRQVEKGSSSNKNETSNENGTSSHKIETLNENGSSLHKIETLNENGSISHTIETANENGLAVCPEKSKTEKIKGKQYLNIY
jgi:hypothetical protein